MQLSPAKFNAFLNAIGQDIRWSKAYLCPCTNPNSGASKPSCPVCGGKGRYWEAGIVTRVGVPSQTVQRQWMMFGRYDAGDMVVTLPSDSPAYNMGEFDRVVALNGDDVFQLPLVHGVNDVIRLPVLSITRCFWLDPTGSTVIEGGLPSVGAGGALTWASGEPPAATQYTVCGTRLSEYFCYMALPSDRGEHGGLPLPKKVVLKKFDLLGR